MPQVIELDGAIKMEPVNVVHFGLDKSPIPEIGMDLEGYYHKDSTAYLSLYGIPEVHTIMRGSYRHKVGWPRISRLCEPSQ